MEIALCLLYGPALITIPDQWEHHNLDSPDLFQQINVSAFQHTVGNGKQSLYIDIRGAPDNKESDSIVNMVSATPLRLFSNIHFALYLSNSHRDTQNSQTQVHTR